MTCVCVLQVPSPPPPAGPISIPTNPLPPGGAPVAPGTPGIVAPIVRPGDPAAGVPPGTVPPGTLPPGAVPPGTTAPGTTTPGSTAPGAVAPGTAVPGTTTTPPGVTPGGAVGPAGPGVLPPIRIPSPALQAGEWLCADDLHEFGLSASMQKCFAAHPLVSRTASCLRRCKDSTCAAYKASCAAWNTQGSCRALLRALGHSQHDHISLRLLL